MAVTEGHEEMILHLGEDLMPVIEIAGIDVCLCASIEYLDMRPFQAL